MIDNEKSPRTKDGTTDMDEGVELPPHSKFCVVKRLSLKKHDDGVCPCYYISRKPNLLLWDALTQAYTRIPIFYIADLFENTKRTFFSDENERACHSLLESANRCCVVLVNDSSTGLAPCPPLICQPHFLPRSNRHEWYHLQVNKGMAITSAVICGHTTGECFRFITLYDCGVVWYVLQGCYICADQVYSCCCCVLCCCLWSFVLIWNQPWMSSTSQSLSIIFKSTRTARHGW